MFQAACRDEDPGLFYDNDHERPEARVLRTALAKDICKRCEVRKECLDTALHNEEAYGKGYADGSTPRQCVVD